MRGLVDYDDSSSSSDEETIKSENTPVVETVQAAAQQTSLTQPLHTLASLAVTTETTPIPEPKKQKVKLLGFNRGLQNISSKPLLEEPQSKFRAITQIQQTMEQEEDQRRDDNSNPINGKRKLPSGMASQYPCQIEPKYHKLNEVNPSSIKSTTLPSSSTVPESIAATNQDTMIKTKNNKMLFVPPQVRNKKGNVTTEY